MELSNLCIAKSCVTPDGFGLFVLEQGYKRGDRLPYTYQGVCVSYEKYDKLNEYLVKLTHFKRMSRRLEDMHITRLASEFDFHVTRNAAEDDHRVDWDRVYDKFIAYAMEVDCASGKTIFWPHFNHVGNVLPDERFEMYGLYMNEPPPYDYFYNTFDKRFGNGRQQECSFNVQVVISGGKNDQVCFQAIKDIEPFDEILFFYGVNFKRHYKINMEQLPAYFEHCEAFERERKRYKSSGVMYVQ